MAVQDGPHQLALAAQGKLEVREQVSDVRAFGAVALARQGVDDGAAEIGSEYLVAAVQVPKVEPHVHRMRIPRQEHDGFLGGEGPFDLRCV